MADEYLIDLPALSSLTTDDVFYVVDDPAGTAGDKKVAVSVLDARYIQPEVSLIQIQVFT